MDLGRPAGVTHVRTQVVLVEGSLLVCVVYNTRVMRLFGSWPFARVAPLVAVVVLLCFAVFLFWPAGPKPEISAASPTVDSPHADQVANGYRHQIDGKYLATFAEEAEASDKLPGNAALLTALLLVIFFGTTLGWLLAFGWTCRRSEVSSLIGCCFPSIVRRHQRRPVAALLGVFLL